MNRLHFLFCIGVIFTYWTNITMLHASDENERYNGVEWLEFGPGIINACKMIELRDGDKVFILTERDANFETVTRWITTNFDKRLNSSPRVPRYDAVEFSKSITLYASETKAEKSMLLSVPLTPKTLDVTQQNFDQNFNQLKTLF